MKKTTRDKLILGGALMVAGIMAVIVVALGSHDPRQTGTLAQDDPTLTTTVQWAPLNDYKPGEILYVEVRNEPFCPMVSGERLYCDPLYFVSPGDYIQVTGEARYLQSNYSEPGWYWPVRGLQGSVYIENEEEWVPDGIIAFHIDQVGKREVPDVVVGETYLINYNFLVRNSPSGEIQLREDGSEYYAWGGQVVTLLGEPSLYSDGHYWCHLLVESGLDGWTYCELQKRS